MHHWLMSLYVCAHVSVCYGHCYMTNTNVKEERVSVCQWGQKSKTSNVVFPELCLPHAHLRPAVSTRQHRQPASSCCRAPQITVLPQQHPAPCHFSFFFLWDNLWNESQLTTCECKAFQSTQMWWVYLQIAESSLFNCLIKNNIG